MYAKWNDILIPAFLTDEEWDYCKNIFEKGSKGIATDEEIKITNELIEKNAEGFKNISSKETFDKEYQKIMEEMKNG